MGELMKNPWIKKIEAKKRPEFLEIWLCDNITLKCNNFKPFIGLQATNVPKGFCMAIRIINKDFGKIFYLFQNDLVNLKSILNALESQLGKGSVQFIIHDKLVKLKVRNDN